MTFSGELVIWLVLCSIGLVAALLCLLNAIRLYDAAKLRTTDKEVLAGTKHSRR